MATNKKFKGTLIKNEVDYSKLSVVVDTRSVAEQFSTNPAELLKLFEASLLKAFSFEVDPYFMSQESDFGFEAKRLADIGKHFLNTTPLGLLDLFNILQAHTENLEKSSANHSKQGSIYSNIGRVFQEAIKTPEQVLQLLEIANILYQKPKVIQDKKNPTLPLVDMYFQQPFLVHIISQALVLEQDIFSYHTQKNQREKKGLIIEKPVNYKEYCEAIEQKFEKQKHSRSELYELQGIEFFKLQESLSSANPDFLTPEAFQKAMLAELDLFSYAYYQDFVKNNSNRSLSLIIPSEEQYQQQVDILKNSLFLAPFNLDNRISSSTSPNNSNIDAHNKNVELAQNYIKYSWPALVSLSGAENVRRHYADFRDNILNLENSVSAPTEGAEDNKSKTFFNSSQQPTNQDILVLKTKAQFEKISLTPFNSLVDKHLKNIVSCYEYKGIQEAIRRPIVYQTYKALNLMNDTELASLNPQTLWHITQKLLDSDFLNKIGSVYGHDNQQVVFTTGFLTPKLKAKIDKLSTDFMFQDVALQYADSKKEYAAQTKLKTILDIIQNYYNPNYSTVSDATWKNLLGADTERVIGFLPYIKHLWKDTAFLDKVFSTFDNNYNRSISFLEIAKTISPEDLANSKSLNIGKFIGCHKPQLLLDSKFEHFLKPQYLSLYFFSLKIEELNQLYQKYPARFDSDTIAQVLATNQKSYEIIELPLSKEPYRSIFKDESLRYQLYDIFLERHKTQKIAAGFWKDPESLAQFITDYPERLETYQFKEKLPTAMWKSQTFLLAVLDLCDKNSYQSYFKEVPIFIQTFLKQSGAKKGKYKEFMEVVFDKFNLQQTLDYASEDIKTLRYEITNKEQAVEIGKNPLVNKNGDIVNLSANLQNTKTKNSSLEANSNSHNHEATALGNTTATDTAIDINSQNESAPVKKKFKL